MSKSNVYCCVPGCSSMHRRNPELSFHIFPKQGCEKVRVEMKTGTREYADRYKVWVNALKIGKPVTGTMRVCSLHFAEACYFPKTGRTLRHVLKKTAVPTLHLPIVTHGSVATTTKADNVGSPRRKRAEKRSIIKDAVSISQELLCVNEPTDVSRNEDEIAAAEGLLSLLNSGGKQQSVKTFQDFEVQVNTPGSTSICYLIKTDRALNGLTGLCNFKLLDIIEKSVSTFFKDERVHKLNIRERIILTFMKLKCNLSYYVLSVLFGISVQLCSDYISKMSTVLAAALKNAVRFVPMTEIKANMPKCFEDFPNVRVIVDCTEVTIQKPKCLCCRIRFYSQYKSNNTVKIMTGVSPAGLITFLSKTYGGRASDKAIFQQSDLITFINRGEAIMVDKGFQIDDVCASFGVELIRPPFLKEKKQLSAEQARLNAKIARARVHVERVNQRLKIFKILTGPVPFHLVPKMDEVFTIICGVTNLSTPILADARFSAM